MIHSVLAKEGDQPVHQCQGLLALRLVEEEHMLLADGLQPLHRAAPPTLLFFMGTGGARAYWLKYIKEKKLQILTNEGKVNQKKLERKIKQKTRSQIKTRKLLDVRLPSSCFMFEAGVFSIYCIFRYCILVSYL